MAFQIIVPTVGESITEVTVAAWHKKSGDTVAKDEILVELESDKATFEVAAEEAGVLQISAAEGTTVPIGGLLATIQTGAASASAPAAAAPVAAPAAAPVSASTSANAAPHIMKVLPVGESITEVTVGTWNKKDGDLVKADEILCEIESDKATFELAAETGGILKIIASTGTTLKIGDEICAITPSGAAVAATVAAPTATAPTTAPAETVASGIAAAVSPVAAAILAEKGINPAAVKGTGPGGKITKEDALRAEKGSASAAPAPAAIDIKGNAVASAPAESSGNRVQERNKMSSLRKTVARRLVAVKNETAMLTTFNEVDMKPIMDLRNKYKDKFKEKHGVGLGFMSFFGKAVVTALQEFPAVNAYIDGDEIIYNKFVDISIAVSAPKGLMVPVIRNAELMNFAQIEAEVVRLATRARDNKLSIDEMTGGTFTITNGGVFGSMLSTPIINAPQSAILGMHNIVERPVVVNGEIVIRPIMYVALSYDHRIIDGRESVGFLVRVKQLLEDPTRLLLEV